MLLRYQLFILFMSFSLFFVPIHSFLFDIAGYKLNKSAFKKKKKGQTFVEWLLFSRFRQEIPKGWIVFFWIFCSMFFVAAITCILIFWFDKDLSFWLGRTITLGVYAIFLFYCLIHCVLFYSRKPGETKFDKWFKKRGNPPKKRKK